MTSGARVLVATDFGPASEAALGYGRELARTLGGSLHVLHVVENYFLRVTPGEPRHLEAAALQRVVDCLTDEDRRRLRVRSIVETSDHPADSIVAYARAANIDLIVIGSHGRTGMERLLGSVADHVIRRAPCPVLTVGPGVDENVHGAERTARSRSRERPGTGEPVASASQLARVPVVKL